MAKIALRAYTKEIDGLIDRGQFEQALAHCRYILKFFPKHTDTYRLMAKAYLESQRYGDASDVFQRVLSSIPDDFVSHLGMSIIREDEGNLDAAIWHMERAFEIQPANAAIQNELRRLYGRRDGIEPPKVRLTRGALARMYYKGELYPQAISELRAALSADPQRPDLQLLLAKSYSRAGFKVEAADSATALLKKLPYCIEGNLILAEILEHTGRSEDAVGYRQRAISLNPYLGQVNPKAPTPEQVPDNAISIEKLEWTPDKGVVAQPQWAASLGVDLDAQAQQAHETPDWLKELDRGAPLPESSAGVAALKVSPFVTNGDEQGLPFDLSDQESTHGTGEELIPDWMKEAGWEPSNGDTTIAERGYTFETPDADAEEQLAPAEIPSWLRAIAPKQEPGEELFEGDLDQVDSKLVEALDSGAASWLGETPSGTSDTIDTWLDTEKGGKLKSEEASSAGLPDWLVGATAAGAAAVIHQAEKEPETESPVDETALTAEPEIMPGFDEAFSEAEINAGAEIPDWLLELSAEGEAGTMSEQEALTSTEAVPDWLTGATGVGAVAGAAALLGGEEEETLPGKVEPGHLESAPQKELPAATPTSDEEMPEWLVELGSLESGEQSTITSEEELPEWMGELQPENEIRGIPAVETTASEAEGELPDWLVEDGAESPAETMATAVASEEIVEGVIEAQPEGELAKLAPEIPVPADESQAPELVGEEIPSETERITAQEEDEAFAWLEGLAAKQGASEALLLTPDERTEEPPDWVLKEAALAGTAAAMAIAGKDEESAGEEPVNSEMEPEVTTPEAVIEELPEEWLISTDTLDEEKLFEWNPEEFEIEGEGETAFDQLEEAAMPLPDLSEVGPDEYLPEWLRATGPESVVAQPEANAEDTLPNWLSEMEETSPETIEAESAGWSAEMSTSVEEENLDWLPKVVSAEKVPAGTTEPDQVSEWLSTLPAIEEPSVEPVPEDVLAKLTPTGSLKQEIDEWEFVSDTESTPLDWSEEAEKEESISDWAPEALAAGAISSAIRDKEELPDEGVSGIPAWLEEPEPSPEATPVGAIAAQRAIEEPPVIEGDTQPAKVTGIDDNLPGGEIVQEESPPETEIAEVKVELTEETPPTAVEEEAAFAWLEGLAVKQGATEALLLEPEERLEEAPEWVREEAAQGEEQIVSKPDITIEEDEEELPAWLIGTAAVGAVEAMLAARDEEDQEIAQTEIEIEPSSEMPVEAQAEIQPTITQVVGEEGTPPTPTEEIDAAYAWLESLAVKQGAEEALLLAPEERLEEAPEWVKQEAEEASEQEVETVPETSFEEIAKAGTILEETTEDETVGEAAGLPQIEEEAALELPQWLATLEEEPAPSLEGPSWIPPVEDLQKAGIVPLDLNEASLIEIERLPGVGFRRAQALVAYRESHGRLTKISDLSNVEGFDEELIRSLSVHARIIPAVDEVETATEPELARVEEIAIPLTGEPGDRLYEARLAVNSSELPLALTHYQAMIQGQDRLPEVIQDLQQTLRHFPDEFAIWMVLGDAQMRSGQVQAALSSYDKAEELLG